MNKAAALEILANYCPDITLGTANNLIADLSELTEDSALTPQQWAEAVFSWNDKRDRKISMIKEVRNRFNLGLKESKDIVDGCVPGSVIDFFPPRHDGYNL